MKYLKKYYEELKSTTYNRAAFKLKKLGHLGRSQELKDWAKKVERDENLVKWKQRLEEFSKFGIFKMVIKNPETNKKITGDFALVINFDTLSFEDNNSELNENEESSFLFFVGLVPTSEQLINECERLMPSAEFDNGFYWGLYLAIKFQIVNQKVKFTTIEIGDYEENLSGNVTFENRGSANKFKVLMKSIFSNDKLNYPSGYTDTIYIYEKLEQAILMGAGFSSDFGFELQDISDYLNTISPNLLFSTI